MDGHRFEILALEYEIQENVHLVLAIRNIFEIEGKIML